MGGGKRHHMVERSREHPRTFTAAITQPQIVADEKIEMWVRRKFQPEGALRGAIELVTISAQHTKVISHDYGIFDKRNEGLVSGSSNSD